MKYLVSVLVLLAFSHLSMADFQTDITITSGDENTESRNVSSFERVDPNSIATLPEGSVSSSKSHNRSYTLNGVFYFEPVENSGVPQNEATFVARSNNVSLSLVQGHQQTNALTVFPSVPIGTSSSEKIRTNTVSLGGEYFLPNIPLVIGLGFQYSFLQLNQTGEPKEDLENNQRQARLGYYIFDKGRLSYQIGWIEAELISSAGPKAVAKQHQWGYRHLFPLSNSQFISMFASVNNTDYGAFENDARTFGIDYYPWPELSLGFAQTKTQSDQGHDPTSLTFSASCFFSENFAVNFSANKSNYKEQIGGSNSLYVQTVDIKNTREGVSLGISYRY